ncbi:MAG: hypothetical protein GTO18_12675 [Anaerolineales bacterium]|nr:hypothetical protein [Anaerolineales bacterium]
MKRLLVVGGASIDVLHLEGRTVTCAGGTGLYTALAARRCGVSVSMLSPRPDPCPDHLKPVAGLLSEWLGPVVSPNQLQQFEISYRGGKSEYLNVSLGAEEMISPEMLPVDLSEYDLVHVICLENAQRQLSFIQACRQRGAKQISAGTRPGDAIENIGVVLAVIEQSDYFFMEEPDATAVFGSIESASTEPGKVLYITMGTLGVCIIQGDALTVIPAVPATLLDPTGAGDAFCGAALAYLLQAVHPIMAAHQASALVAEMIGHAGPAALMLDDPPPGMALDARVQVNGGQVRKVAEIVPTLSEASPYPFVSPELPPVGHPRTLDYFFVATLQQFSFWTERDNRYDQPLIAKISGVELKGSDYLWEAFRRRLEQDEDFCSPERQASLSREELLEVFRADDGEDPMPALDLHLEQAQQYGRDMLALQLTPQTVLQKALASTQPLQTFLVTLDHVGGYKEDPIRKKSLLLALILNARPETFFPLRDDEEIAPIADYHLMRICLRTGMIDVLDSELVTKLADRQIISPAEEWAVRYPAYLALEELLMLSGTSLSAVNNLLFTSARKRCFEMTEPQCRLCPLDSVCAHRREMFQPVMRTSFY